MRHPWTFLTCAFLLTSTAACSDAETTDAVPAVTDEARAPEVSRGTIEEARAMLDRAAAHYEEVGREQALADFTAKDPRFVDRDLYVFCYGPDRLISSHGGDESLVGDPVDDFRDVDGKAFGTHIMEVAEAGPEGGLATYKWTNPVTGQVEGKVSVVRFVGEDVCGVGAYEPAGA
jgi:cytochrome c